MTDRQRDFICITPASPLEQRMAVVREVAARHMLGAHLLLGPSRTDEVCLARWEAMAELQKRFGDKSWKIARVFRRDPSTVYHGLRRAEELGLVH